MRTKPTVPRVCQTCGAAFLARASDVKVGGGLYCARACYTAARVGRKWSHSTTPLAERFWSKVNKTDSCWLWTGATVPRGYGKISEGRRDGLVLIAPRVSWELHYGPIPEGAYVCHRCDVPACVRPDHLFLGTPLENTTDMWDKGRARTKITAEDAEAIRLRYARGGVTHADLGRQYGISPSQVRNVVHGASWSRSTS